MKQEQVREESPGWKKWLYRAASRALESLPELAAARLESEARKLGAAAIPQIVSRALKPLDPSFNEELLDVSSRAELTLRNRFALLNQSQNFGQEIDWESSASRAWGTELHSFGYALDLAVMFRVSGEQRYARHLQYLVAHWIAANPPLEGSGWAISPLARRIRNWTLAFDLARAAWQADSEFARVASRSLALQSVCLERESHTDDEPATAEIAVALLLGSKLFSQQPWARRALEMLRAAVKQDLPPGGSRLVEPSTRVGLAQSALEFILFEPNFEPEIVRWLKQTLESALRSVEEILLPDGSLPLFGATAPPRSETVDDLLAAGAVVLEAGWAKTISGNFGFFPLLLMGESGRQRYAQLPAAEWSPAHSVASPSGLYRMAGAEASCLAVTAATASVEAGHEDFLSYELMMRGRRVVVDSGAGAPAGENGEDYFKSPGAHNVLLGDGKPGELAAPHSRPSPAAELSTTTEFTRLRIAISGAGTKREPRERFWFSLPDGTWVVLDRLDGGAPHRLTSLIHLFPTFEIRLSEGLALAASHSMTLRLIPFGTSQARVFAGRGNDAKLPGWYSPDYGIRYAASVLAFEWDAAEGAAWTGGYAIVAGPDSEGDPVKAAVEENEIVLDRGGRINRLPLGKI
jgi:Heparinase II/III-like protein/Heparinase II/III N-terminus